MRTDRHRYTEWRNVGTGELRARELYDHANNPQENVSLAGDPANKELVRKLSLLQDQNRYIAIFKSALARIKRESGVNSHFTVCRSHHQRPYQIAGRTGHPSLTKDHLNSFKSRGETRTAVEQAYNAVYGPCEFEKGRHDVKVVFGPPGKVSGLWIQ